MKKPSSLHAALLAASASALVLAACGGGSDDNSVAANPGAGANTPPVIVPPVNPNVPNTGVLLTATQTASGAFAFTNTTASTQDDTGDPIVVGDATLATSDTDEPTAI